MFTVIFAPNITPPAVCASEGKRGYEMERIYNDTVTTFTIFPFYCVVIRVIGGEILKGEELVRM